MILNILWVSTFKMAWLATWLTWEIIKLSNIFLKRLPWRLPHQISCLYTLLTEICWNSNFMYFGLCKQTYVHFNVTLAVCAASGKGVGTKLGLCQVMCRRCGKKSGHVGSGSLRSQCGNFSVHVGKSRENGKTCRPVLLWWQVNLWENLWVIDLQI